MYKSYRPLSIWREMDRLQREMNRVFDSYSSSSARSSSRYPAMNVWADEESALITVELPGLKHDDIELNIVENVLTLSGERKPAEEVEGTKYHRQERRYGKFSRTTRLPYKIDVEKVEAVFKNGVLSITLPRVEEDRPKKIAVKVK